MSDFALIGIDGGATEMKGHLIEVNREGRKINFALGTVSASHKYAKSPGFTPVDLQTQLKEHTEGRVQPTDAERSEASVWIQAAVDVISEIARKAGQKRVLVGMGMPGLKTPDGRGIAMLINGPRMPDFLARVEEGVASRGIELVRPIHRLGSDADYCGLGEEFAQGGKFRRVKHAYYAGMGTGVADALKIGGRLLPLDQTKSWLLKSWQIPSALGPTFEKLSSARSMNLAYANYLNQSERFIEETGRYAQIDAAGGHPVARGVMETVTSTIAELFFERIWTVKNGRQNAPWRGDAYMKLDVNHPFRGILLQRLILGQRLGFIYADPAFKKVFARPLETKLAALISESGDAELKDFYLTGGRLKRNVLVASTLRSAPAIGAGVDAFRHAGIK
ncbi:MAG: hypothetical protein Kow0059_18190 [Candidatus Sumerlaeia bacterium]